MKTKSSFPVDRTRELLEPGPIVLVSSAYQHERNIMTMGWHMMMEYTLIGCYIWDQNTSRRLIEQSGECVINIPTSELLEKAIDIGNLHKTSENTDKFEMFGLTPATAKAVKAPLIEECYANIECKLIDTSLIASYSLFVFEAVHVHKSNSASPPQTFHYLGDGQFRILEGEVRNYKKRFGQID